MRRLSPESEIIRESPGEISANGVLLLGDRILRIVGLFVTFIAVAKNFATAQTSRLSRIPERKAQAAGIAVFRYATDCSLAVFGGIA